MVNMVFFHISIKFAVLNTCNKPFICFRYMNARHPIYTQALLLKSQMKDKKGCSWLGQESPAPLPVCANSFLSEIPDWGLVSGTQLVGCLSRMKKTRQMRFNSSAPKKIKQNKTENNPWGPVWSILVVLRESVELSWVLSAWNSPGLFLLTCPNY